MTIVKIVVQRHQSLKETLYRLPMKKQFFFCLVLFLFHFSQAQTDVDLRNQKVDGYRGIWFELNQKYEYGDKYSGGLGTYTAKHIPLAIYAPEANKTFFVYGGTTKKDERHLLCMVGSFDHTTGMVSKPLIAYDKKDVDDPHDNPTISIDDEGYVWIFVSGRSTKRLGVKLKSTAPFSIERFEIVGTSEFTYPQIWHTENGFFHFFTKYSGVRELYFETSKKGKTWSPTQKLAGIPSAKDEKSGHYQVSNQYENGEKFGTFFNRHIDGHPDTRTDLYYTETSDNGASWTTVGHKSIQIPISEIADPTRVVDYHKQKKNVYMKDMAFDKKGNPVCLYITSGGHEPGPQNAPYEWRITAWNGKKWHTSIVCASNHNYDMGSLFVEDNVWTVVGPTENGPQKYGVGGEIAIWTSKNAGKTWHKKKQITANSALNNSYVRRPLNHKAPFNFFWANGNPEKISSSELFFGDFEGNIYLLPYDMKSDFEKPLKVK